MRSNFRGIALGKPENRIRKKALKRAERRAVDGVDNQRDAGPGGGDAAENAGFAAVSVNNVGA